MKKLLAAAVILMLGALLAAAVAAYWIHRQMNDPLPLAAATTFEVPPGAGLRQVSARLHEQGIIEAPEFFHWYARALGRAASIRAGEYLLEPGISAAELLDLLVSGDVVLHTLTVVEGWTFSQMQEAVRAHPAIRATSAGADPERLMNAMGASGTHPEGQFFPETYRFARGTSDIEIFRQAYTLMQERLQAAWSARESDLPLSTAYEALVLASIIEKETALLSERRTIAGVFISRLRKGMRLQTDPTVIYGLGPEFDGNLRKRDLLADTPYNTYTRAGLPPTPIALPGEASLLAAVQPEETGALYFVATGKGDGSHYFSSSLEEHNRAVQRYLQTLRERRKNP